MKLSEYPITAEAQNFINTHAHNNKIKIDVVFRVENGFMCEYWKKGFNLEILARKQPIYEYQKEKQQSDERFYALLKEINQGR